MNTQINQQSRTLRLMAVILAFCFLALFYSIPSMAKPACPGHPSCKDTIDEPIQLGPDDDEWPGNDVDNNGDDIVFGGDGSDHINGGYGDDELYGEGGEDELFGGEDNDRLNGGDGFDELYGEGGSDHLYLPVSGKPGDEAELMDFADGGEGYDYLHLNTLAYIELWFPDLNASFGEYTGYYFVIDKKSSTKVQVEGSFDNIEFIYCSTQGGIFHGNDFDNKFWGDDGDDVMYGYAGNDELYGGFFDSSNDSLNGGAGNDKLMGLGGNDELWGGDGEDVIYTRRGFDHDVMWDFTHGEDIISVYNSDVCFADLEISAVDWNSDGIGDTYITWPEKKSSEVASLTLVNINPEGLGPEDFDFTEDTKWFSSDCP